MLVFEVHVVVGLPELRTLYTVTWESNRRSMAVLLKGFQLDLHVKLLFHVSKLSPLF